MENSLTTYIDTRTRAHIDSFVMKGSSLGFQLNNQNLSSFGTIFVLGLKNINFSVFLIKFQNTNFSVTFKFGTLFYIAFKFNLYCDGGE
jgi:hypothetical protein